MAVKRLCTALAPLGCASGRCSGLRLVVGLGFIVFSPYAADVPSRKTPIPERGNATLSPFGIAEKQRTRAMAHQWITDPGPSTPLRPALDCFEPSGGAGYLVTRPPRPRAHDRFWNRCPSHREHPASRAGRQLVRAGHNRRKTPQAITSPCGSPILSDYAERRRLRF